jgi:NAD-dependent deacetylase
MTDESSLEGLAASIREAETVVALTGAGVSTASGIPDFRGPDGIWTRFDVEDFRYERFERDPAGFWRDRLALAAELYGRDPEPNAAHEALADMDRTGRLAGLVTQNVDGLHQAAGHREVVELHGNGQRVVCTDCGRRTGAPAVRERVRDGEVPPRCADCDGVLKPDVVLFGERLPDEARLRAQSLAQRADAFLAVGSSLTVEPAASLPREAATRGATLGLVNLEPTPLSGRAEFDLRSDVTEALPRLRDLVEGSRE